MLYIVHIAFNLVSNMYSRKNTPHENYIASYYALTPYPIGHFVCNHTLILRTKYIIGLFPTAKTGGENKDWS